MSVRVGVPREVKVREYRVGLVPAGVREVVAAGGSVVVEAGAGQGVAHLDDGTMVVVDQAREHVKETIDVMIQKFMQTQSGRILFGSRV